MSTPGPVPLDGRPWRLTMGLRPLDLADWLQVDHHRDVELAAKRSLYAAHPEVVAAVLPDGEPAALELAGLIWAWLAEHRQGPLEAPDPPQPVGPEPIGAGPLVLAALAVQEDLCVMERRGGRWTLTAASVSFPSRWRLADKMGADLDAIHAPVPGYGPALAGPVAAYFDRITVARPVWRANWTLLDTPELHLPDPADRRAGRTGGDPAIVAATTWLRVERQTLRRLPATGAVAFTIRTYVTALPELVADHPETAAALRTSLVTAPSDTRAYKGWEDRIEPLVTWLGTFPRS